MGESIASLAGVSIVYPYDTLHWKDNIVGKILVDFKLSLPTCQILMLLDEDFTVPYICIWRVANSYT